MSSFNQGLSSIPDATYYVDDSLESIENKGYLPSSSSNNDVSDMNNGTSCNVPSSQQRCTNCGVPSKTSICTRCHQLPRCWSCKRYLSTTCFADTNTNLCRACLTKKAKPTVHQVADECVNEVHIVTDELDATFEGFLSRNSQTIHDIVDDYRRRLKSIRVHMRADAMFVRETEDGEMRVPAYFSTMPQDVDGARDLDLEAVASELSAQVEHWNSRGSGFNIQSVVKFVICITKYRPLHGSTYIRTPNFIRNKHCTVNVKNHDLKCFVWAILSCLYPATDHADRLYNYLRYEHMLNTDGLSFPMSVRDIPKFEKQNSTISINVLSLDNNDHGFCMEYVSPERERPHHVNLLLLEDDDKRHYVWIKNMSFLVAGRTKNQHQTYVCNGCLHPFSSKGVLNSHIPNCLRHPPQAVKYPDPENEDECILKFRAHKKQFRLPFYLVCDFEAFVSPTDKDDDKNCCTRVIEEHNVCGFACYRVTDVKEHQTDPVVYSGPDVMDHFYEHIIKEKEEIARILKKDRGMTTMTEKQLHDYDAATNCGTCGRTFTESNWKVRHHCHVSGDFLFAACNNCNLQLKMNTRKRKIETTATISKQSKLDAKHEKQNDNDNGNENHPNDYFLPVVFHNLKSYDAHFVIKHFEKKYTARYDSDGKVKSYDDIKVTPVNSEKYIMFEIGKLRFLDSFQFLSTSLDNLVSLLHKSGRDKFVHTKKYLGDSDLVFAKGVYPYSYMTGRDKFSETQLPPIEDFYNSLSEEKLDDEDYNRAQKIWTQFNIENLQQYHDHYLLSDILLLTDVLENFRDSILDQHGLDFLHFMTLPSLAWACALKYTSAELELITDPDAFLMLENSMRGGIATISHRHATANNPLVQGYDETEATSYITYLDANNLYGTSMSEPLPVGNFRFLNQQEIDNLDLLTIPPNNETGYIVECDLLYPEYLHPSHNDYPMAPEHLTVNVDMLSPFARKLIDKRWKPSQKLIPNLMNKSKYVCHYRNLQFYISQGLILQKIHRILSFSQRAWLKPWIDHCTEQRMQAKSEFESDLAKLQANATFGKTMEQMRNRVNVRLICDPQKLTKAVSKVSFRQSEIINNDLVMVRAAKQKITLNKPIAVGFTILEISKLIMYQFYYNYLKPKYGDACKLLFTDTDSFCCRIQTNDLYADMGESLDLFDTSNFETAHPLYSLANRRALGKFKSETGSKAPREFVGLRAKMYSLNVPCDNRQSKVRAKGIKKSHVKKHVRHDHFLDILHSKVSTKSRFRTFRSKNHTLQTVEITKTCLSAFDDKRYILADGIHTLAYGHRDIKPCVE